jgi:hypothetical protein
MVERHWYKRKRPAGDHLASLMTTCRLNIQFLGSHSFPAIAVASKSALALAVITRSEIGIDTRHPV